MKIYFIIMFLFMAVCTSAWTAEIPMDLSGTHFWSNGTRFKAEIIGNTIEVKGIAGSNASGVLMIKKLLIGDATSVLIRVNDSAHPRNNFSPDRMFKFEIDEKIIVESSLVTPNKKGPFYVDVRDGDLLYPIQKTTLDKGYISQLQVVFHKCDIHTLNLELFLITTSSLQGESTQSKHVPRSFLEAYETPLTPEPKTNPLPVLFSNELFKASSAPVPVSESLNTLFSQLQAESSPSIDLYRKILIQSLHEQQAPAGSDALRKMLLKRMEHLNWDDPTALDETLFAASCARNLDTFQRCSISPEVWTWLFNSEERVRLVAETLTDADDAAAVSLCIQTLYKHDPKNRDHFFNLILAMAVVWDTPRTEMHQQIGEGWLPPDEDLSLYYDYFSALYQSPQTKVAYPELTVNSLIFVVNIPAPASELEWALNHIDGTRSSWGKHYQEIIYDDTRLYWGRYTWPHRDYTLKEIEECFGICVDQAYYCVISARAHGIPALYFQGQGKYFGHAWFGFLKRRTEWDLDIGRYSKQGYAIGVAIHPQTDVEMTDHELKYFCSRTLQPDVSRQASALVYLATLLNEENRAQSALIASQKSREVDPLFEDAWKIESQVLADEERLPEAIELLKAKAITFKYFPDVVTDARQQQASLLHRNGNSAEAEKILGREVAHVASKRDDLQQELVIAQADQLLEQGKSDKGMDAIERLLRKQKDNGRKVVPLIVEYKAFAKRAGISNRSDNFLRSYYRTMDY